MTLSPARATIGLARDGFDRRGVGHLRTSDTPERSAADHFERNDVVSD